MKENKIVLDCSQLNCISEILEQAQQVRMTTEDQSYFITSLVSFRNVQHNSIKIGLNLTLTVNQYFSL